MGQFWQKWLLFKVQVRAIIIPSSYLPLPFILIQVLSDKTLEWLLVSITYHTRSKTNEFSLCLD
jgi:hypothetical protein